ncbi:hypothetical protein AC26_0637 [Escherichia coli 1-176-05_S3_C2]|nr:hypothetical protein AC26_0637 [Escherichia coli 1-176-05_S3_C2]
MIVDFIIYYYDESSVASLKTRLMLCSVRGIYKVQLRIILAN